MRRARLRRASAARAAALRSAAAVLLTTAAAFSPCRALDTIYLVRHAEKASPWRDDVDDYRPLSPDGTRRAERLAAILADAGIVAIYTSPTTRTIATGMPLAEAAKVPITPARETIAADHQEAFLTSLRDKHPGRAAVLIVGHSDTLPRLLDLLGADAACHERLGIARDPKYGDLVEGYDGLWRVDLAGTGCARITRRSQDGAARR